MMINKDFVLQEIAEEYIVVPIGDASEHLHGIIRLNESGAFLWKLMENSRISKEELTNALSKQYKIDGVKAEKDVEQFLEILRQYHCFE